MFAAYQGIPGPKLDPVRTLSAGPNPTIRSSSIGFGRTPARLSIIPFALPRSVAWSAVEYGGGKYVAIAGRTGASQYGAWSTDGLCWTEMQLPSSQQWNSLAWSGYMWVAACGEWNVATAVCATSQNGINWTSRTITSNQHINVGWNGQSFVIMPGSTAENTVLRSVTGEVWTNGTFTQGSLKYYGNMQRLGQTLVMLGNTQGNTASTETNTSVDGGLTWTQRTSGIENQAWNNGSSDGTVCLLRSSLNTRVALTRDGINWQYSDVPSSNDGLTAMPYNGYYYIVKGSSSNFFLSPTGTGNWVEYTNPVTSSIPSCCRTGPNGIVNLIANSSMGYLVC